jgi:peptidoglycan/LPS O-acetylase OafA/YrhL
LYGLPLCTVAAAVVILTVVNRSQSWLARALSWRPLTHLGTVSYGLYLWNLFPGQTFRLFSGRHPGVAGTIGCALLILIVVELSYWYVERPFLRWAKTSVARAHRDGRSGARVNSRVRPGQASA